jgi:hypothetical protein
MEHVDRRQQGALGGTVLRGQDGSLYFIRDELLAAFRVEGEGLERLEAALTGREGDAVERVEVQGRAAETGRVRQVGFVRGSLLRQDPRNVGVKYPNPHELVASTVMCPWFC